MWQITEAKKDYYDGRFSKNWSGVLYTLFALFIFIYCNKVTTPIQLDRGVNIMHYMI